MRFNDLLEGAGIAPERVLVMRHTRKEVKGFAEKLLEWARNKPATYNAHQRFQSIRKKGRKTRRYAGEKLNEVDYLASFIGHGPRRALFVGFYRVGKSEIISREELLAKREFRPLKNLKPRPYPLGDHRNYWWFSLRLLPEFASMKLKLEIVWDRGEIHWCHRASEFPFPIIRGASAVQRVDGIGSRLPSRRELKDLASFDEKRLVMTREEQKILRRYLLSGREQGPCFICGEEFPVKLLVAAHIKPRKKCSNLEKGNLCNVVPMCLAGCDALFERGYIVVVRGRVRVNVKLPKDDRTPALNALTKRLDGRPVGSLDPARNRSLNWHASYHGYA